MGKRIWLFAGEISGDIYGANVIRQLRRLAPDVVIEGMGGLAMKDAGMTVIADSSELGVTGFVEVIRILPKIWKVYQRFKSRAREAPPDVAVFIDYPGFNLRMAGALRRMGVRIVYYISPQIWAWHRSRIHQIAGIVDHMLVILPFEEDVYRETSLRTTYVGHPLMEILGHRPPMRRDSDAIALLPGSRMGEVSRLLPAFHATARYLQQRMPRCRFLLPTPSPSISSAVEELWEKLDRRDGEVANFSLCEHRSVEILQTAQAGLAASGTVTLQAAILGLPLVVAYKVNSITYHVGKHFIKLPWFSLPNWILRETVFEEFLQNDVVAEKLAPAVEKVFLETAERQETLKKLNRLREMLDSPTPTSELVANVILEEAHHG
ncbi:MAG: lipid-A-disaccharide synthase [Lentisphaerae bacterium]|nr:MAG: lipid-A-disaccharide synthase [Lentisphaerota bacterium]